MSLGHAKISSFPIEKGRCFQMWDAALSEDLSRRPYIDWLIACQLLPEIYPMPLQAVDQGRSGPIRVYLSAQKARGVCEPIAAT